MSIAENLAVVGRVYAAINAGDADALDALVAVDVESNVPFPHADGGLAGFKEVLTQVRAAFPDYTVTIADQIAQDDKVVTRYTATGTQQGDFQGVAATGAPIELVGIDIDRLADGKIVEHWSEAGPAAIAVHRGVPRSR